MDAVDLLFVEHWNKFAFDEPLTDRHIDRFEKLRKEYPLLPMVDLVAYTYADSLFGTDEDEA